MKKAEKERIVRAAKPILDRCLVPALRDALGLIRVDVRYGNESRMQGVRDLVLLTAAIEEVKAGEYGISMRVRTRKGMYEDPRGYVAAGVAFPRLRAGGMYEIGLSSGVDPMTMGMDVVARKVVTALTYGRRSVCRDRGGECYIVVIDHAARALELSEYPLLVSKRTRHGLVEFRGVEVMRGYQESVIRDFAAFLDLVDLVYATHAAGTLGEIRRRLPESFEVEDLARHRLSSVRANDEALERIDRAMALLGMERSFGKYVATKWARARADALIAQSPSGGTDVQ